MGPSHIPGLSVSSYFGRVVFPVYYCFKKNYSKCVCVCVQMNVKRVVLQPLPPVVVYLLN